MTDAKAWLEALRAKTSSPTSVPNKSVTPSTPPPPLPTVIDAAFSGPQLGLRSSIVFSKARHALSSLPPLPSRPAAQEDENVEPTPSTQNLSKLSKTSNNTAEIKPLFEDTNSALTAAEQLAHAQKTAAFYALLARYVMSVDSVLMKKDESALTGAWTVLKLNAVRRRATIQKTAQVVNRSRLSRFWNVWKSSYLSRAIEARCEKTSRLAVAIHETSLLRSTLISWYRVTKSRKEQRLDEANHKSRTKAASQLVAAVRSRIAASPSPNSPGNAGERRRPSQSDVPMKTPSPRQPVFDSVVSRMEARRLTRLEAAAKRKERLAQREIEARRAQEEAELRLLDKEKQAKRAAKAAKVAKAAEAARMAAARELADKANRTRILSKYGFLPWRRLMVDKAVAMQDADEFYRLRVLTCRAWDAWSEYVSVSIQRRAFSRWRAFVERGREQKRLEVIRSCWDSWSRSVLLCQVQREAVADVHYRAKALAKGFRALRVGVLRQQRLSSLSTRASSLLAAMDEEEEEQRGYQ